MKKVFKKHGTLPKGMPERRTGRPETLIEAQQVFERRIHEIQRNALKDGISKTDFQTAFEKIKSKVETATRITGSVPDAFRINQLFSILDNLRGQVNVLKIRARNVSQKKRHK